MTKKQMESLVAGLKIQSKKDSSVYEIVGIDLEQGKVILDNGKLYTLGTIQRWYSLVEEEEIPEVVEPDNTVINDIDDADELTQEQDTDTTTNTATTNTNTEDTDETTKKDVKTATTGTTKTEGQQIFENSISGVVLQYGCHLNRMNQYIKVGKQGYKGCLVYIRKARDKSWKFDVSKRTWNKLTPEYQTYLVDKYDARIVDSTRGLWRVCCNELDVFEVLLLTAIHSSQE